MRGSQASRFREVQCTVSLVAGTRSAELYNFQTVVEDFVRTHCARRNRENHAREAEGPAARGINKSRRMPAVPPELVRLGCPQSSQGSSPALRGSTGLQQERDHP